MPVNVATLHAAHAGHGAKTALTIQNYTIAPRVPGSILVENGPDALGNYSYGLAQVAGGGGGPVGVLPGATIVNFMNAIENLCLLAGNSAGADGYRGVKQNAAWQQMYSRAARNFDRLAPAVGGGAGGGGGGGPVVAPVALQSYPCHYCGLMVPESMIQVDHQKPKGGGNCGLAVLKVFRAVNNFFGGGIQLTAGNATGTKNTQANAISAHLTGAAAPPALAQIPPKGLMPGHAFAVGGALGPAKTNRYTLTADGETLLTSARMLWGQQALERLCINNILNLVPSCPPCNNSKSDLTFYQ